jgi:hypothetical protein
MVGWNNFGGFEKVLSERSLGIGGGSLALPVVRYRCRAASSTTIHRTYPHISHHSLIYIRGVYSLSHLVRVLI